MNADLREGVTDGRLKKRIPNTTVTRENARATAEARQGLMPENGFSYGGDACGDGNHP